MTNEHVFPVELGGRHWDLPRLPWRIVRKVQPGIARQSEALVDGDTASILRRLDAAMLAEQTHLVLLALQVAEPELTLDQLDELPITLEQLAIAQIAVLSACGLEVMPAAPAPAPAAAPAA